MTTKLKTGPVKRYTGYFTIPITNHLYDALEKTKWATRLDKTEVARRVLEYFLTMHIDDQEKLLKSFDVVRKMEDDKIRTANKRKKREVAASTSELKTVQSLPQHMKEDFEKAKTVQELNPALKNAGFTAPNPPSFKRSGLP